MSCYGISLLICKIILLKKCSKKTFKQRECRHLFRYLE